MTGEQYYDLDAFCEQAGLDVAAVRAAGTVVHLRPYRVT
jgi:hypothetical protein